MSEIIECNDCGLNQCDACHCLCDSNVRRLREERDRYRKALAPFSNLDIEDLRDRNNKDPIFGRNGTWLTVGDIRKAKQALSDVDVPGRNDGNMAEKFNAPNKACEDWRKGSEGGR